MTTGISTALQAARQLAGGAPTQTLVGVALGGGLLVAVVTTALIGFPAADDVRLTVTPPNAALRMADMAPGDSVRQTVSVANSGSLSLRYAMRVVVEDDPHGIADQIRLTVGAANGPGEECTPGDEALYRGPLASGAIGNPRLGHDAGDRLLAVGASEQLCLEATYLPTAPDTQQGAAGTVTFSFSAEGPADP